MTALTPLYVVRATAVFVCLLHIMKLLFFALINIQRNNQCPCLSQIDRQSL